MALTGKDDGGKYQKSRDEHNRKVERYKKAAEDAEAEELIQQAHDDLGIEYPHPPNGK